MKAVFLFFLSFASLYANSTIDDLMPKQVQQQTGVSNLSPSQKKALAEWLSEKIKDKTPPPKNEEKRIILSENRFDGKVLVLSDESVWEIAPEDVDRSSLWLTPFPVKIERSDNPNYPYKIVNLYTGSSVKARKTDKGEKQ